MALSLSINQNLNHIKVKLLSTLPKFYFDYNFQKFFYYNNYKCLPFKTSHPSPNQSLLTGIHENSNNPLTETIDDIH